MSEAELFKDRIQLLFDTRLEELLEELNKDYPNKEYREELIEKGAELITKKEEFEERKKALESDEYKNSHNRIMNTIKSEFQEAKDLTDQEMYKKAREYNKKYTIWKETSKTMEELDDQLLLDKRMKQKIDSFINMVQDDIEGRQFDISGKSFLQGMSDKDTQVKDLEKEKSDLIDKHTRDLAAKDVAKESEKDAALAVVESEKDAALAVVESEKEEIIKETEEISLLVEMMGSQIEDLKTELDSRKGESGEKYIKFLNESRNLLIQKYGQLTQFINQGQDNYDNEKDPEKKKEWELRREGYVRFGRMMWLEEEAIRNILSENN